MKRGIKMEFPRGSIKETEFESSALGEHMQLLIYLPASFSTLTKYSLLIAQDGRDYFQLGRIGRIADELLHNQVIDNLIIVGVPYKNVEDRRRKYHPNGEQQPAYLRFLAHELVPFLDKEFPTFQMGMGRALAGDSLAASISLQAALKYPNIFGKVLLQSPYVNDGIIKAVEEFNAPHLLNIYHIIGTEETAVKMSDERVKDFLTPNRELSTLIKEKGFPYFYEEFNGNHTWTHWQPDLKRALKTMF